LVVIKSLQRAAIAQVSRFLFMETFGEALPTILDAMLLDAEIYLW